MEGLALLKSVPHTGPFLRVLEIKLAGLEASASSSVLFNNHVRTVLYVLQPILTRSHDTEKNLNIASV